MTAEEWPEKVDIDGRLYNVHCIGVFPPEEGQLFSPLALDFRVTGGLVPPGEVEYVRLGGDRGVGIFIVEPSGTCIPCDKQRAKGSETLAVLAARYVNDKRKETKP